MGALVLCLFAFVLAHNEAWAAEQPSSIEQQQLSSTEQQRPTVESTTIVNGKQVDEPAPESPPVGTTTPFETSPIEKRPPPPASDSVPPKADPEPAPQPTPLQRTVVITTTGGETDGPGAEPASAPQQSEPATTTTTTTTPSTTPAEPAPVSAIATPTPDLGSPETEIPAAAEEGSAALPTGLSAPSEVSEPVVIPGPALEQVAQDVVSQEEQARPVYYSSSGITPADTVVQPLARALTDLVGMNTAAAASAVADVLGTVGGWLAESTSGETESPSGGIPQQPLAPLIPEPLGSSYISLFSGGGQTSAAGGAGATLLLGVLSLTSILLLRRDIRTYLVSCELPKPSSALLSPLERPG